MPNIAEQADEILLESVFARRARLSLQIVAMAQQVHEARALWLGETPARWSQVPPVQKARYMQQVETLVKEKP